MTNPTDWRALCAELHAAFNTYAVNEEHHRLLVRTADTLAQPEQQGSMNDRYQALIYAGYMADLALGLVGGQGLNGTVYPVHPDKFSDLSKKLRHAAEQYNNHILEMYRRLND